MSEHIDYDCSGLLQRQKNLDQTGDELIEIMMRTCNGRLTCAEALGHREFVLTRSTSRPDRLKEEVGRRKHEVGTARS
jgi:altronate dehydratase